LESTDILFDISKEILKVKVVLVCAKLKRFFFKMFATNKNI